MLNSRELETLHKYEQFFNDQFNAYSAYINDLIDKKHKFNLSIYLLMLDFYKNIIKLDINEQYTQYATYILDKLKQTQFHNQYLRHMKLKKINELNDTKN